MSCHHVSKTFAYLSAKLFSNDSRYSLLYHSDLPAFPCFPFYWPVCSLFSFLASLSLSLLPSQPFAFVALLFQFSSLTRSTIDLFFCRLRLSLSFSFWMRLIWSVQAAFKNLFTVCAWSRFFLCPLSLMTTNFGRHAVERLEIFFYMSNLLMVFALFWICSAQCSCLSLPGKKYCIFDQDDRFSRLIIDRMQLPFMTSSNRRQDKNIICTRHSWIQKSHGSLLHTN